MAVFKKVGEPGASEFSHGKGLMPPEESGYPPSGAEQLRALYSMDNIDPEAVPNYIGEGFRTDKPPTVPVRDKYKENLQ